MDDGAGGVDDQGGAGGAEDAEDALALAEPAVDMSKHKSGIIPILQCARRRSASAGARGHRERGLSLDARALAGTWWRRSTWTASWT
jgi:hypothetical protein